MFLHAVRDVLLFFPSLSHVVAFSWAEVLCVCMGVLLVYFLVCPALLWFRFCIASGLLGFSVLSRLRGGFSSASVVVRVCSS